MANWSEEGFDGITQCGCADDPRHNWGFVIVEVSDVYSLYTNSSKLLNRHQCIARGRYLSWLRQLTEDVFKYTGTLKIHHYDT